MPQRKQANGRLAHSGFVISHSDFVIRHFISVGLDIKMATHCA